MSARKLFLLLSLLLMLGVLVTLPQSTQAGERGPLNAKNAALNAPPPEDQVPGLTARPPLWTEEEGKDYLLARSEYAASRRLAGDVPISEAEAAEALFVATQRTNEMKANAREVSPNAYGGAWTHLGPDPIAQILRSSFSIGFMAGRIGALAMRSDGRMILGGATGGVWVYNTATDDWEPKTDNLPAIAIGALAVAASNEEVVYAGTGEGELAGDAAAGNGVLKSLDGGMSWFHVSGAYFRGVAVSNIAVDPTNPDHVFIATIRGRGGSRRTTTPPNAKYGIWESTNGGLDWTLLKGTTNQFEGATDLRMDPQDPLKLYASFWTKGIYKSTDGGQNWTKIMNGFPADADYAAGLTRFAIAVGHPVGEDPVLYAGFDYVNTSSDYFPSRVWKSVDEGANWTILPAGVVPDKVEDYCGGQCFFDNVIEVDPADNDRVFAAGQFDYGISSGGVFRSDDGGMTWKNLGYDQHPDFHALAFNPSNTQEVIVGSDGGVWYSADQGGRPLGSDPLDATTWENLNGNIFIGYRPALQIAQFTSIQTVPTVPGRYWGGTQDNGTMRKSTASTTWSDLYSGDGGQVLVDPTDHNYVYGHYFGITPYRATDGGGFFFNNFFITGGIDLSDRAEFYIPATMNHGNPNQLFLGTYRVYRTDNAKTADPADVLWKPISPDLTSGCLGGAPNGGRGCHVSAIGVSRGSGGTWAGSIDGYLHYAKNGAFSDSPTWKRVGAGVLPNRPIAGIAVDHSNSRIAYIAYNGYNGATPGFPGHVFKTTNGGKTFTNITGNLPNVPHNWIVLDPSLPDTLYVGTDVGPFITNDGGATWAPLGTGFPIVPVWQMDLDPLNRVLVAGTHGRGAFRLTDAATLMPALVLSKTYPDVPVGPDSDVSFTLKIENIGNTAATGIEIKDKLPKNTSFVSASDGGFVNKGFVKWTGLSVPSNSSITVTFTLHINASAKKKIQNKNFSLTSAEGVGARGTPRNLPLAKPNATMVSPLSQKGAQNPGEALDYTITVRNTGYNTDTFNLSVGGSSFGTEVRDASCTSIITSTSSLSAGDTEDVCIRVTPPVAQGARREGGGLPVPDTATVKATSATDSNVKQSVEIVTYPITAEILLVDQDGDIPDVQSYYTAALDSYGAPYDVWDLNTESTLPINILNAHGKVVWFTGNTYPGPLLPYEDQLAAFLDDGGDLFMSGQDILDQAAGTTTFVHDYLHIDWDGSEDQNDKPYASVTGVGGNPVTGSIGTIAIDNSVLGNDFMDWITPISPATAAFTEPLTDITALTLDVDDYGVVFLAFPFEEYGTAGDRATLLANAFAWFETTVNQAADQGKDAKKDKKDKKKDKQGGSSGGGN